MRLSLFGLVFSVIFFHNALATQADCQLHRCVAVIDAGSTKSYLHVYQFDLDQSHTPSHIQEIASKRIMPGLAQVNPKMMSAYLNELLEPLEPKNIPVFLYATAGMRLLPSTQQHNIYQAIHEWFDKNIDYRLKAAETISGQREAVYDWVSANYQAGRLSQPNQNLMGVMDTGGASVQIAYPLTSTDQPPDQDIVTLNLYQKKFTIFAHSFLGLGQTEVMHQLLDEPGCYSIGMPLADLSLGNGKQTDCEAKVNLLLDLHRVNPISHASQSFEQVSSWYVMGGLSALAKSFAFHFEMQHLNPEALMHEGVDTYCHTSWLNLSSEHPNDSYLATQCLASVYFHSLLVHGYGFSEQQSIEFSQNGSSDDWTMGVVLVEFSH
jgi:hypothetical protein